MNISRGSYYYEVCGWTTGSSNDGGEILSRQMQRIEQGMGRGVRANDDYCVVRIVGSKLTQRVNG